MRAEEAKRRLERRGFEVTDAPVPRPTLATVSECRRMCESNECGCYGLTWACPPGSATPDECLGIMRSYDDAIVMTKTYAVDINDRKAAEAASMQFQTDCREAAADLREGGADLYLMADGKCGYCEECTYPDAECAYPDMLIPSISGFGIIMDDYLKECDRDFSFRDGEVEFFGILLLR